VGGFKVVLNWSGRYFVWPETLNGSWFTVPKKRMCTVSWKGSYLRFSIVIGTAAAAAALVLMAGQPAGAAMDTTAVGGAKTHYCGSAGNGLAVIAISGASKAKACPTARKVGNLYLKNAAGKKGAIFVKVNKIKWRCGEKGKEHPYIECVNQRNKREKIRLLS
jgi:hypothetical protein